MGKKLRFPESEDERKKRLGPAFADTRVNLEPAEVFAIGPSNEPLIMAGLIVNGFELRVGMRFPVGWTLDGRRCYRLITTEMLDQARRIAVKMLAEDGDYLYQSPEDDDEPEQLSLL